MVRSTPHARSPRAETPPPAPTGAAAIAYPPHHGAPPNAMRASLKAGDVPVSLLLLEIIDGDFGVDRGWFRDAALRVLVHQPVIEFDAGAQAEDELVVLDAGRHQVHRAATVGVGADPELV